MHQLEGIFLGSSNSQALICSQKHESHQLFPLVLSCLKGFEEEAKELAELARI